MESSNQPQLFLDDSLIADMKNLKRDVKHPVKSPANPLLVKDFPWEKRYIGYCSVLYDEEFGHFRCWHMGSEHGKAKPEYYVCYAESKDGYEWNKPMVGEGTYASHTPHNIVIPGGHGACVMKTPWDPAPKRLYKAAGGDVYAVSPDGINWQVSDWKPSAGKNDTCTSFVWWKGEYLAYVRYQVEDPDWPGVMRGVGLCVSKDFNTWTPKELILTTDEQDGYPWVQPHALCATVYGDQLIGLLPVMSIIQEEGNNIMGEMDVQLVTSHDGRKWHRVADRAVFWPQDKSEPMARRPWDLRFHPGSNMFVKDDVVYLYYNASKIRWGEGSWRKGRLRFGGVGGSPSKEVLEDKRPQIYAIGLATLPADRFVSLRPNNWEAEGILETKPLTLPGGNLTVNAELGVGELQVELLDESGKVIPGFSGKESHLTPRDNLRFRVEWSAGETPFSEALAGRPVSIRFILRNGDLYAFQFPD